MAKLATSSFALWDFWEPLVRFRSGLKTILTHPFFEIIFALIVIADIVILSLVHYDLGQDGM